MSDVIEESKREYRSPGDGERMWPTIHRQSIDGRVKRAQQPPWPFTSVNEFKANGTVKKKSRQYNQLLKVSKNRNHE